MQLNMPQTMSWTPEKTLVKGTGGKYNVRYYLLTPVMLILALWPEKKSDILAAFPR